jgi:hypothetical protein
VPTIVQAVVLYVQLCVYGPCQVSKHESAVFDSSPLIYIDLIWPVKHSVPLFTFPLAFTSLLGLDGFYLLQCVWCLSSRMSLLMFLKLEWIVRGGGPSMSLVTGRVMCSK